MLKIIITALAIIPVFISCTQFHESTDNVNISTELTNYQQKTPSKTTKPDEGKSVYMKFCLSCHQKDASGVPGMYPSLQKNKVVTGDKKKIINIVINGLQGEIEVNGEVYNQTMPPQNYLTNKQIAEVLSFLRQNFENKADSVKVKEVNIIRK